MPCRYSNPNPFRAHFRFRVWVTAGQLYSPSQKCFVSLEVCRRATYHIGGLTAAGAISCAVLHCHSKHLPWQMRGSPHCYSPWWSLWKHQLKSRSLLPKPPSTVTPVQTPPTWCGHFLWVGEESWDGGVDGAWSHLTSPGWSCSLLPI